MAWEMCTQNLKHAYLWNKFSGKTRGHEHLHEKLVKGIRRRLVVNCPWNRRVGTFSRRTVFGSLGRTPEAGGSSGTFVATHFQARTYLPWTFVANTREKLVSFSFTAQISCGLQGGACLILVCYCVVFLSVCLCASVCLCCVCLCVCVFCLCVLSVCGVCTAYAWRVACGLCVVVCMRAEISHGPKGDTLFKNPTHSTNTDRNLTWTKRDTKPV